MKNFTVDQYKALLAKIANGEIVPKADVPADANNGEWLNNIERVTVDFEK